MSYFIDISLLRRNRDFRLLYCGQFISFFGTMVSNVAVPYQIYHETHSILLIGLLSFLQLIPLLITALLGGVLADRHHRKPLLLITESILSLACLALVLNSLLTHPKIWLIFAAAIFISAVNGLHRPAVIGLTQQIVAKEDFTKMSALSSFSFGVSMIVGPALGGMLIAHFGLFATYGLDFLSFVVSLFAILRIENKPKPETIRDQSTLTALAEGCRYALSKQSLLGSYLADFFAMIFGMPNALFPALAVAFGGAKTLGFLYAAPAVGALLVALISGWTARVERYGAAIIIAAILWGFSIIGFGLSHNLYLALVFLALAGAFDAISGIFRQTLWNREIPENYRGRLAGIEMISYMSGPKLGDAEAGLIAAAFGITTSIISGGILCVVSVALCASLLPAFWQYRTDTNMENTNNITD